MPKSLYCKKCGKMVRFGRVKNRYRLYCVCGYSAVAIWDVPFDYR